MSIALISLLKTCDIRPAATKLVLLWMCDAASDDGSGVWKSADTLAEEASCVRRTVFTAWEQLEAAGLIIRDGVKKNRGGSVTVWRINVDGLKAISAGAKKRKPRAKIAPGAEFTPSAKNDANPVQNLHKPRAEFAPKPSINHKINLTRDGEAALARLLDAAASAGACDLECSRLVADVRGFHDGNLIVGGRYAVDRYSQSLREPLRAAGLRLALAPPSPPTDASNVIPLAKAG